MADRSGVFTRKGAPPTEPADSPDAGASGSPDIVECPNCKCQFNPDTDEIVNGGGGDQPSGPDVPMPTPAGNAQAPIGEDAITRALAGIGVQ